MNEDPHHYQVPEALAHARMIWKHNELIALLESTELGLPVALLEETAIQRVHEAGERGWTTLWHTDYNHALDEWHERFQQYNRLDLYDDGRMVITEIKPGEIFSDTVYIEPGKVAEVREYIKAQGFNWIPKPQWYLKEGIDMAAYRKVTSSYDPAIDDEILKAMMDDSPDTKKRGGAVYAFDREAQLLPDNTLRIRLQGSHRAPVDKTWAYKIDDIPSIIRK